MSCVTGMVWSLYEPQKQGGISMILEELKKIKSFGSDRESCVTPEDIADKERELGFTLPQALQEFYLTFHENDPVFRQKTGLFRCVSWKEPNVILSVLKMSK